LWEKEAEIAQYPIARVTGKPEIDLSQPVNPVWAAQFNTVVKVALPDNKTLTEADWAAVGARFAPYTAWKNSKAGTEVEILGYDEIKELLEENRKDALLELVAKDAALAEEANKLISQYRQYFPKTEDAFMYDLTDGKAYSISCGGMNATTTVRTIK
jgi:hypothetical protein